MKQSKNIYYNGMYIFVENNILHRVQCHHAQILQLEDSSFADELISNLDFNINRYKRRCQFLIEEFEHDKRDSSERAKAFINNAIDLAIDMIEINSVIGELLYAKLHNAFILTVGIDGYHQLLIDFTKSTLMEPLNIRRLIFQVLCQNADFDDPKQWLEQSVLPEIRQFCNSYQSEYMFFISGLRQIYFFNSITEYYIFMLMHFANENKRIQICEYCGNFFVPKTKRTTLYCDRVIPNHGKTCKQLGPKLSMKMKLEADPLLAEYERAKNRYYKRVERTDLKKNTSISGKSLTFEQYEEWYHKASVARRKYLSGEISGDEFRGIILELD